MAKRWYVVHAYSGYENQVRKSLQERVRRAGMEDMFGEILVPTEEVVEMREGQKRRSERKFFPGYVLVQMEMNEDTWHLVRDVPKVMGFIGGTSDRPAPISEREADAVHRLQRSRRRGQLRKEPVARRGSHLRPLHAGGAGVRSGREGLAAARLRALP